jgi:hypothetical protein
MEDGQKTAQNSPKNQVYVISVVFKATEIAHECTVIITSYKCSVINNTTTCH